MNNAEVIIGIVVTVALAILLVFAIVKIWAYESKHPTEKIVPE